MCSFTSPLVTGLSLLFGIQGRPRRRKPFSPDKKQGTWRNFCTSRKASQDPARFHCLLHHTHVDAHTNTHLYMCTGTHKHVCSAHIQAHTHTYMCTAHINTQKRVCAATRAHVRAHTNTCTCVRAHSAPGAGPPLDSRKAPTTWAGPVTPAASAFLLQDLLPGGCHMPVRTGRVCVCVCAPQENRVCVCVPHRRI